MALGRPLEVVMLDGIAHGIGIVLGGTLCVVVLCGALWALNGWVERRARRGRWRG